MSVEQKETSVLLYEKAKILLDGLNHEYSSQIIGNINARIRRNSNDITLRFKNIDPFELIFEKKKPGNLSALKIKEKAVIKVYYGDNNDKGHSYSSDLIPEWIARVHTVYPTIDEAYGKNGWRNIAVNEFVKYLLKDVNRLEKDKYIFWCILILRTDKNMIKEKLPLVCDLASMANVTPDEFDDIISAVKKVDKELDKSYKPKTENGSKAFKNIFAQEGNF